LSGSKEMSVVVTGGGSGIGLDVARNLGRDGALVTIVGRSADRLAEARKVLVGQGLAPDKLREYPADVSNEDQCRDAMEFAASLTGQLDAIAACAGEPRGQMAPVTQLDLDQWRSIFDNNVTSTMLTLKYGARELVRAGGGAFVAISSISAVLSARFAAPISAAKAAVDQLVRVAARELGADNVRVNAIRPGLVQVERQNLPEEMKQDFLSIIPMHRLGEPHDIADVVRFLIGPAGAWITGQVINVDGGQTLVRAFDASSWVPANRRTNEPNEGV
jgi:NAD(P)-dependent dehydrogenase (short-subunit alcohol dehydrogenase family)